MAKGKKMSAEERETRLEANAVERRTIFKQLCDHVATGLSLESFSELHCQTIERYFKTYPREFVRAEFELFLQKGRESWERIGLRQANGTCIGNSRTWYYNMSNRYGWSERQQIDSKVDGNLAVNIVNYASKHTQHGSSTSVSKDDR